MTKVLAPTTPSTVVPNPQPETTKRVVFEYKAGKWEVDVWQKDEMAFFTDRDFNQLGLLLNYRRADLRRKAFMAYQKAVKAKEVILEAERIEKARKDAVVVKPVLSTK